MFKFITRQEAGLRPPTSISHLAWSAIDTIYVHYTSMLSDMTGDPKAKWRGVQNYHMLVKKWADVAYNWAFTFSGEILAGRGWNVRSAATGVENSHSVAFVFLGGDRDGRDDVTPKGRDALGKLIREALRQKRLANGPNATLAVKGHTQAPGAAGNTACPGLELLHYIALRGWEIVEPVVKYPRYFYLFAAWRLGEGDFKPYGPHNLSVRPKQLPRRGSPVLAAYWIALRHFLLMRKK